MTRNDRNRLIIWVWITSFVLFTPHLCAQTINQNDRNAAETRQTFVDYGKKYIGLPYVSGATGPNAFDCSGFVYAISRESIGYQLPRTVRAIYSACKIIDESNREPGDLVFFRTTASEEPSHIGIYIGNSQFLHCASDGPNTGVILSSLNESYWKGKYYKTGSFLPASKSLREAEQTETATAAPEAAPSSDRTSFADKIILDATGALDWNFFTSRNFKLTFRGLAGTVHAMYDGRELKPGLGTTIRWDSGTGTVQIPLFLSLTMTENLRIFAGPVFTIGTPYLPGTSDEKIKRSVFPGILGLSFNTPSFKAGKTELCFVQDIHYTVFNDTDGSALSVLDSLASGLVFSSGLRVTVPLRSLYK